MIHTWHINFVYHNSVNESGSRKFHFYLNSRRKSRSYVEEGLGGFSASCHKGCCSWRLFQVVRSGEKQLFSQAMALQSSPNIKTIKSIMEPAQKSEFFQLRLKQTQKNLSLTDNTDTAVHAWIVSLR